MVRKLLYLNGWASWFVVLYHASAWGFIALFWWADRYRQVSVPNFDAFGGVAYYALRLIEAVVAWGIPAFLFVSGFFSAFAAGRSRRTIGFDVIFPRIKNLFIPYFLWSCIYILIDFVLDGARLTPLRFVQVILSGQAVEPFYFVPVLIQLYLLSPLVVPIAKKHPALLLALTGVLQLTVALTRYWLILGLDVPWGLHFLARSWLFVGYSFWFAFGMVIGFHQARIKAFLARWRWPLLAAALFAMFASLAEWELLLRFSGEAWIGPRETLMDQVYSLLFLCVFIGFENLRMPLSKVFNYLGTNSFGVYLVHTLGLVYAAKLVYRFAPALLGWELVFQIILYTAGLGLPLLLMWFVDHSPLRRLYSTIFG